MKGAKRQRICIEEVILRAPIVVIKVKISGVYGRKEGESEMEDTN
jgi:hypothetical protein